MTDGSKHKKPGAAIWCRWHQLQRCLSAGSQHKSTPGQLLLQRQQWNETPFLSPLSVAKLVFYFIFLANLSWFSDTQRSWLIFKHIVVANTEKIPPAVSLAAGLVCSVPELQAWVANAVTESGVDASVVNQHFSGLLWHIKDEADGRAQIRPTVKVQICCQSKGSPQQNDFLF